ncbi:MAG: hypothetical protein ABIM50_01270 [Novosphingobium sp.]
MNGKHLILTALASALIGAAPATTDNPEPGRQGETMPGDLKVPVLPEPYSKGVRVVGHAGLGEHRNNLIMAWSGHCAYVANDVGNPIAGTREAAGVSPTSGVAVIDVRNPAAPKTVGYLQDKGALEAAETMHAATVPGRAVLAASTYGFVPGGAPGVKAVKEGWLDVYDVSDCAHPRLMAEVKWPEPVHTLTVSPNGRRVYGTIINPFTGNGGIQVMDISDLAEPRFLGRLAVTRPDGTTYEFATHEISISPDERRIYAGVIASKGGDLNRDFKSGSISAERLGPEAGGIYILDNSDIAAGKPDPKLRLVGTAEHGGWHSAVQARIGGVPHLVGAGELLACPGSWPRISNIADEAHPRVVGQFRLQMNLKENCPSPDAQEAGSAGILGRKGTATSHFNDVDSATDSRLGLFPFMYAGLRIADLRNPANPSEIAYFKPGDPCMSHVRYVPRTGHIWFACTASGFWVIELTPQVRAALKRSNGGGR